MVPGDRCLAPVRGCGDEAMGDAERRTVIPSERRSRASEASRRIVTRWRRGLCTCGFSQRAQRTQRIAIRVELHAQAHPSYPSTIPNALMVRRRDRRAQQAVLCDLCALCERNTPADSSDAVDVHGRAHPRVDAALVLLRSHRVRRVVERRAGREEVLRGERLALWRDVLVARQLIE